MKRYLFGAFGALAAMVLLAQPAFASGGGTFIDPGAANCPSGAGDGVFNFTFKAETHVGGAGQALNKDGQWICDNSPAAPDLSPLNSPFLVFCVDHDGHVNEGDTYSAFATDLSVAGFAAGGINTEQGAGAAAFRVYWNDIWIINNYFATGHSVTDYSVDYQFALWSIGFHDTDAQCIARFGSGCSATTLALLDAVHSAAVDAEFTANPDEWKTWRVITDIGCGGASSSPTNSFTCPEQELVYNTFTTPEPASMSLLALGLAGMAGAGLRRRKRKS